LTSAVPTSGQKALDDIVVSGEVKEIQLCSRDSDVTIYQFIIRMQAENVGQRPVIISTARAFVDYYKVAPNLNELNAAQYAHIGWVTSGPRKDPASVPKKPISPFKAVAPRERVGIDLDFRTIVFGELKPGPTYLQVVAENWPEYSDDYVEKLKSAWESPGLLWAHSLHTQPISFVMPTGLTAGRCP
jgi:hypothetical protein